MGIAHEWNKQMRLVIVLRPLVMDNFSKMKESAHRLFHHQSVFQNIFLLRIISSLCLGRSPSVLLDATRVVWAINLHVAAFGHGAAPFPIGMPWPRARSRPLASNPVFLANLVDQFCRHPRLCLLELCSNPALGLAASNPAANLFNRVFNLVVKRHILPKSFGRESMSSGT